MTTVRRPKSKPLARPSTPARIDPPVSLWRRLTKQLARVFGSLQFAILLLALFAGVLLLGTIVESWYDRHIARQLVYGTWWFLSLLGLLGVNILCAALKKRPWKKYQTGFLITHVGLLTLVSGGVVTNLFGTHGMLLLVDSEDSAAVRFGPHASHEVTDRQTEVIRVRRTSAASADFEHVAEFRPGSAAWLSGEWPRGTGASLTDCLTWLARPWPRSWSSEIDPDTRTVLEVLEYQPHVEQQLFAPDKLSPTAAPALKFQLQSSVTGALPERWVSAHEQFRSTTIGPARIEMLAISLSPEELENFRHPTVDAIAALEKTATSEPRGGDAALRAILQFATAHDGTLWFRAFHSPKNKGLEFESAGVVTVGEKQRIWASMGWKFQVVEFLPHAKPGPFVVPVPRDLGAEDLAHPAAIRCVLRRGAESQEFWVPQDERSSTAVTFGGERFSINYAPARHALDFALTLARGEQTTDPGSTLPASQSSYVLLTDPANRIRNEGRMITMNEPLVHGGYNFFQSGFQALGKDSHGKQISRCSLTVTRDPGVRLKYAGATMVALGIACMFYMRAYFFGRKGSSA